MAARKDPVFLLAISLIALGVLFRTPVVRAEPAKRLNLLLITIDTLRRTGSAPTARTAA